MAIRDTQDCIIFEVPNVGTGHIRDTQDCLIFEVAPLAQPAVITYPLSPPAISGIGPQDYTITFKNVVAENVSPFTLSEQEQQWQGDVMMVEANLPPMLFPYAEQWNSFLLSLFGKSGTCLLPDYNRLTPQGPMSGAPVVSGPNASGVNVLNVRGAAAGVTNWAVAGDYIQITAGTGLPQRMYKILQNASSNSGGDVTLDIRPCIREALSDGTPIITSNCAGTFRLIKNSTSWKITRDRLYAISFQMREAMLP